MLLAGERSGPLTLILAGVAISSLAGALTTLALNLSPNPFASVEMLFWLMGSLTDRSLVHVWLAAPLILAGGALLLTTGRALDALTLGEEAAQNLGVDLTVAAQPHRRRHGAGRRRGDRGRRLHRLRRPRRAASAAPARRAEPRRLLPRASSAAPRWCSRPTSRCALIAPLSELRLGVVTALDRRAVLPVARAQDAAGAGAMNGACSTR